MRDPKLETSGKIIGFYEREFYCFSNFSSFKVEWQGKIWMTSEHAYQAARFLKTAPAIAEEIYKARSAHEAKKIMERNRAKEEPNWETKKVGVMEEICSNKLKQNPYIQKKLRETGTKDIVEDSPVDGFWGWGPDRKGRNELGKIWMRLREKLSP
ncbi:MAG: NADAR family protein [Patescibacteria group bacterium]